MTRTKDIYLHEVQQPFWETSCNPITGYFIEPWTLEETLKDVLREKTRIKKGL